MAKVRIEMNLDIPEHIMESSSLDNKELGGLLNLIKAGIVTLDSAYGIYPEEELITDATEQFNKEIKSMKL